MAVANVGSTWKDGNLIFFSKLTGQEILIFDAENEQVIIPDGSGIDVDGDSYVVTEPDEETIEVADGKLSTKGATGEFTAGEDTVTVVNGLITAITD